MPNWLDSVLGWVLGPTLASNSDSSPSEAPPVPPKVPEPIPAPIAPPTPVSASLEAIADILLAANGAYKFDSTGLHPFVSQGGALHRLDRPTALGIAQAIVNAATGGLTVPYLLACIGIESVFDPLCENGNYSYVGHTGSNPDKVPEGFDVGLCQLKIKYLMEDRKLSVDDAYAFAKDYTKAIPYMATTMKLLLGYADALIQDTKRTDAPDGLLNRYCIATGAYNYGRTGMKQVVASAVVIPTHCKVVMANEKVYATKLSIPSVF